MVNAQIASCGVRDVALMVQAAELSPGDRVLEVDTGSGHAAAVISQIAREVHTPGRGQPRLSNVHAHRETK